MAISHHTLFLCPLLLCVSKFNNIIHKSSICAQQRGYHKSLCYSSIVPFPGHPLSSSSIEVEGRDEVLPCYSRIHPTRTSTRPVSNCLIPLLLFHIWKECRVSIAIHAAI